MQEQLRVPQVLHVGYQERSDTYTKQLAYIVYEDEKGVRRKETSWLSWTSDTIPRDVFQNDPTEGFVLNRHGGGGSRGYSWDSRNEFVRVWDPRNFEFEISLANLLFILENCTSTKGKGLEGKFVYAWSGTTLVLLPEDCAEYKASTEFTSLKSMKVTKKEMVPGLTYEFKDQAIGTYLGRLECKDNQNMHNQAKWLLDDAKVKRHVFKMEDDKHNSNDGYRFEKGFTKLARITDNTCHVDYATMDADFIGSKWCSKPASVELIPVDLNNTKNEPYSWHAYNFFIKEGNTLKKYSLLPKKERELTNERYINRNKARWEEAKDNVFSFAESELEGHLRGDDPQVQHNGFCYSYSSNRVKYPQVPITCLEWLLEQYPDAQPLTPVFVLESGTKVGAEDYVKE